MDGPAYKHRGARGVRVNRSRRALVHPLPVFSISIWRTLRARTLRADFTNEEDGMSGWMKNAVAAAAVATSVASTAAAFAANDMFLKLDGIKGESMDNKHKGEIDVLAWSWGIATPVATRETTGAGAGKVVIHDIVISKRMDTSSPKLLLAASSGQHIKEVTLVVRKAGREQQEFLTIKLQDVLISSFTAHATQQADIPLEEVKLNFARVEVTYKQAMPNGDLGPAEKYGWDVKQNVKL
jgi:type VI secretion system secreted protein Hcp